LPVFGSELPQAPDWRRFPRVSLAAIRAPGARLPEQGIICVTQL